MSKLGILPSLWIDLMWLNFSVGDMSVGRQEAFEIFRRDYYNNLTIEENKHNLKQRYAEAKSLGEGVNKSRQRISKNLLNTLQALSHYKCHFQNKISPEDFVLTPVLPVHVGGLILMHQYVSSKLSVLYMYTDQLKL